MIAPGSDCRRRGRERRPRPSRAARRRARRPAKCSSSSSAQNTTWRPVGDASRPFTTRGIAATRAPTDTSSATILSKSSVLEGSSGAFFGGTRCVRALPRPRSTPATHVHPASGPNSPPGHPRRVGAGSATRTGRPLPYADRWSPCRLPRRSAIRAAAVGLMRYGWP